MATYDHTQPPGPRQGRLTILARRYDATGARTLVIVRTTRAYAVCAQARTAAPLPLPGGQYRSYEDAWARLCDECGIQEEEGLD